MLRRFLQGWFMNHPLHPLLVHIPVGLWVGTLIFDIIAVTSGNNPGAAAASYYCILIGFIGAILAAIAGLAEYVDLPVNSTPRKIATIHLFLNLLVTGAFIVNFIFRYNMNGGIPTTVTGGQLILTLVSLVVLGVSGYLGGVLVYDYGVGFRPQDRARTAEEQRRRVESERGHRAA